ncbi:MAG: hypothetical protein AVDCRST_MAG56-3606 [uncultured Cytophagales bacterium]|uniref:Lipocalin-like domain-containing protein n=1 Tax=uncultured Cytophagales bacterium TaxID=158755 RepID=A0A6J4JJC1_9SPHI|nr:MAG: hypothetical protein AVDCRST_MAG56-3606 [uncultured Cytophagales bacterium]
MNKNLSFLLSTLMLVSMMLGLQGCPGKKTEPTPETKTSLLTRNWKVQKVTATSAGTPTTLYEEGAASNQVNYAAYRLNFTSATNYTRTDQNAVESSGGWSFNAGETQINFNPGTPPSVNVITLTKDSFVFTYTDAGGKNGNRELRFEMVPL